MSARVSLPALIASVALAACLLICALPVAAYATTNVEAGETLDTNREFITENKGTIVFNEYRVEVNRGRIENNSGAVTTNEGAIQNNYGQVPSNNGIIVNNFSVNVGTTSVGASAKIVNNYHGGYAERLRGSNNFYKVVGVDAKGLDWSLNDALLSANTDLYVGDPDNPEGLRGATFKAREGYRIEVKVISGNGFHLLIHQDGAYGIEITDKNISQVDLGQVIKVERLVKVDTSAAPAEGGAILMNGVEFKPGYYDFSSSRLILQAIARDGYEFAGWSNGGYDEGHVRIEADGDCITVEVYNANHVPSIELWATFEKIESPSGSDSGSDSGANSSAASGNSLAPTGDNVTAASLAAVSLVSMSAIALCVAFVSVRRRKA